MGHCISSIKVRLREQAAFSFTTNSVVEMAAAVHPLCKASFIYFSIFIWPPLTANTILLFPTPVTLNFHPRNRIGA